VNVVCRPLPAHKQLACQMAALKIGLLGHTRRVGIVQG
jgi:hypothetical protein